MATVVVVTLSAEEDARKKHWRTRLLADRTALTRETHSAEAVELAAAASTYVADLGARTVCGYVPIGSEPGSLALFDDLREHGCRVLMPVVVGAEPLQWAEYTGADSLRSARYGLREPAGPRLGQHAVGQADVVFVPALAVDGTGVRLGRGAGHYDRSLPLASGRARLVGVVGDHEFVPDLPGEAHDVRMNAVLTPKRGVVALPL